MESKKTARADLSRKSFLFFNVGLITSLSVVIAAFEYKSDFHPPKTDLAGNSSQVEELVDVPVTQHLPPPPKIVQPQIVEVPDAEIIERDINVDMDVETTESAIADYTAPIEVEVEEEDANTLFTIVEESASPVGGINAFNTFVAKNIIFPAQARRMEIAGKVFVEFVVERDGTLTNVRVIKGIGAGCDEEAVRVVNMAPKWNPGKQRGKAVRQKMILPITFRMGAS